MTVQEFTSRSFVFTARPWLLWILSGALVAMGLIIMVLLGQSSRLMCDRTEQGDGFCALTQANLLRSSTIYFPVDHLQTVQLYPPQAVSTPSHAIWLHMGDRYLPIQIYATLNDRERLAIAGRIQRFLYNPDLRSLEWVSDNRWFAYGVGWALALMGISLSVLYGKVVTGTFDKQTGQFTLRQQGVWQKQQQTYPLEAIAAVQLETSDGSAGSVYRVCLRFKSQDLPPDVPTYLPLTPYYGIGRAEHEGLMQQIQSFLNRSF
ncbi:MAG: hypothetical protein IGR80_05600 [Synechococcales cyanobacterium K44_A2020_017]|nr:hypothetical protein [Synechococcales cyanobacterium K32_A2020_035]MBF2094217.1 hypothetical protein [Synechococcales cyanobacterium K44_A2020_017]